MEKENENIEYDTEKESAGVKYHLEQFKWVENDNKNIRT